MFRTSLARALSFTCALLIGATLSVSARAQSWVEVRLGLACDVACKEASLTPVSSGTHPSFGDYYVCSVNAEGEGWRPGYNLPAFAPDACVTGYGGVEWFSPEGQTYLCLCR